MKTYAEGMKIIDSTIGGRYTTAHGYTNPYGAQCIALIAWFFEQIGYLGRIMPGYNAIDVYNANPLNMEKITDPRQLRAGDAFFKDYWANGVNYGHTGLVQVVTSTGVWSVDQNWYNASLTTGSPAARVFHPFSDLKGGLRPAYSKGELMIENETQNNLVFLAAVGRHAQGNEKGRYIGKTFEYALNDMLKNSYRTGTIDVAIRSYLSGKNEWQEKINQIKAIVG